jgi:hypothetical protein
VVFSLSGGIYRREILGPIKAQIEAGVRPTTTARDPYPQLLLLVKAHLMHSSPTRDPVIRIAKHLITPMVTAKGTCGLTGDLACEGVTAAPLGDGGAKNPCSTFNPALYPCGHPATHHPTALNPCGHPATLYTTTHHPTAHHCPTIK